MEGKFSLVLDDLITQHLAARMYGLHYLTDRELDVALLSEINEDTYFSRTTKVLQDKAIYALPVLANADLSDLIRLRSDEAESFELFRTSLNAVTKEYIQHRKTLTPVVAGEIYDDLIKPSLDRMTVKVNTAKRRIEKSTTQKLVVGVGSLAVGLTTGFVPATAAGVGAIVVGLAGGADYIANWPNAGSVPDEVRNDDFYFLWKANRI